MILRDAKNEFHAVAGMLKNPEVHHGSESGFFKKIDMIERAKRGTQINLAYFIYEDDYSSSYLTQKLIAAASRGVKVHMLIDYFMAQKYMPLMSFLQAHEGINVLLWRPASREFKSYLKEDLAMAQWGHFLRGFATQNPGLILKGIQSSPVLAEIKLQVASSMEEIKKIPRLTQVEVQQYQMIFMQQALVAEDLLRVIPKLKKMPKFLDIYFNRMHHKTLSVVTDRGLEVIVGGRNISDEYHIGLEELALTSRGLLKGRSYPFIDSEVSGVFTAIDSQKDYRAGYELMWNANDNLHFIPVALAQNSKTFNEQKRKMMENARDFELRIERFRKRVAAGTSSLHKSEVDSVAVRYTENLYYEDLDKKEILKHWKYLIENINPKQGDIEIISAYMYLYPEIISSLKIALEKGVNINIYTNSFVTTDLNMVNVAAYRDFKMWQQELTGNAIGTLKFYELDLEKGTGSLHAKIMKVGNTLVIGSANLDPRNFKGDTNNMMFLDFEHSPGFANKVFQKYLGRPGLYPWKELTQETADYFLEKAKKDKQFKIILQALRFPFLRNEI